MSKIFKTNFKLFVLTLLLSIIFINPTFASAENNPNAQEVNQYEQTLNDILNYQSTSQNLYSKSLSIKNPLLKSMSTNSTSDSMKETEPNNFEYQANTLLLDTFISGRFNTSYDTDYYKLQVTNSGKLILVATVGDYFNNHFYVGLFDESGGILTAALLDSSKKTRSLIYDITPGTYYIAILEDSTDILTGSLYTFKAIINPDENANVPVAGVLLDKDTLTLLTTDTPQTLSYTISPDNATNKSIIWTSSNPDIVSVSDDGIVKALKQGTSTITLTTVDGNYTDTCNIDVVEKIIDDIIYKEWTEKTNIESDKIWNIKFNMDINSANSDNVYVTDEYSIINTKIEIDGNIIKVIPISNYESGKTYYLIIKNVIGENNKSMKENIRMKFSVKNINNEEELEIIEVSNINNLIN